ncbi:MAG TPA: hypothetical protein VI819_00505 [Patescibacteria group bacterium]|nr:hypothetical protein [Patescibacteria group bacterium]
MIEFKPELVVLEDIDIESSSVGSAHADGGVVVYSESYSCLGASFGWVRICKSRLPSNCHRCLKPVHGECEAPASEILK